MIYYLYCLLSTRLMMINNRPNTLTTETVCSNEWNLRSLRYILNTSFLFLSHYFLFNLSKKKVLLEYNYSFLLHQM